MAAVFGAATSFLGRITGGLHEYRLPLGKQTERSTEAKRTEAKMVRTARAKRESPEMIQNATIHPARSSIQLALLALQAQRRSRFDTADCDSCGQQLGWVVGEFCSIDASFYISFVALSPSNAIADKVVFGLHLGPITWIPRTARAPRSRTIIPNNFWNSRAGARAICATMGLGSSLS